MTRRHQFVIEPPVISEAARAELLAMLKPQGVILLPHGSQVVDEPHPKPTTVQLPPPEDMRVMFWVVTPYHPRGEWCTGRYYPNGGGGHSCAEWWDDRTASGDDTIKFSPDQVTHWMPLPPEPTS